MDQSKKVYIDSRCKTNDSISNSDLKFELQGELYLPGNSVLYRSFNSPFIPHSWYTV